MPPDRPDPGPPPLWPWLILSAVVAAWIDLGTIQRHQHADSLLYAMVSLWRVTPFLWGQDRVGMLVPLLASPISNPLANLLAQDWLNIAAGIFAFPLLARYTLREAPYAAIGVYGASLFVLFVPTPYQAMYFIDACYGVWLSLGLGALILLERRTWGRVGLALVLLLLAHWVNYATALALGPLALFRGWMCGPGWREFDGKKAIRSETAAALVLLGIGAVFGRALTALATVKVRTPTGASEAYLWPESWAELAARQWEALAPGRWPAALGIVALAGSLVTLGWPAARSRSRPSRSLAAALALAAVVAWLYTGTRLWSRLNGYTYRYTIPSAFLLQLAALTLGLAPPLVALGKTGRRAAEILACVSLLGASAWTYGLPSVSRVRSDLDRKFGRLTPDLVASRSTHLAGAYYDVWPAVFLANLRLHEEGEARTLWAISGRAESTFDLWRRVPSDRVLIALPNGDREAARRLEEFGVPQLVEVERRPTLRVYRPREPTAGPLVP